MSESTIFNVADQDAKMLEAVKKAQATFKYFWRELSWEYRRIVPALNIAAVKVAFREPADREGKFCTEHMWINEVNFDGEKIYGTLLNEPTEITLYKNGDPVETTLNDIDDWLFTNGENTFGGFSIQAIRSGMDDDERAEHDKAWGINFGDCNDIMVVYQQKEHPENLAVHPMDKNMQESLRKFMQEHPEELNAADANGNTWLHRESIAGNIMSVRTLLGLGADKTLKNRHGKIARDYATDMGWDNLAGELNK